ncbi:angiopoietin-4-like [Anopheles darlingi]|uniref:angiopoietin-4-like n=1 Tax=Anopheles darlingi TaxID=43151 RepID=UPI00210023DF|nr:angiopoietin-4-like [Anopheles darlingi]
MKSIICFLLLCATSYAGSTSKCPKNIDVDTSPIERILESVLEEMLNRFDDMDRQLLELQMELNEHREEVERKCIPNCVSSTSSPPQLDTTTPTEPATTTTTTTTQPTATESPTYASCKDVPANVSGVYLIRINNTSSPFKVYCEMEKFGGGWVVVQHRFDGSVDFYRNWTQYRDGFGELNNEFWLGLEYMHQLTTARTYELMVEMKDFSGDYGYASYNAFQIGSESEQYRLKTLGSYSGTAGDSMTRNHKGSKFSTKDRDNDPNRDFHFAVYNNGAWWYGEGNQSNLNGPHKNVLNWESIWWWTFKNKYQGLSFTRMMIREL